MTTLWAQRHGTILKPVDGESAAQLAKLPDGTDLRVEILRPRNIHRHRLFWLICERIGAATGVEAPVIADLLKIETGHYALVRSARYGDLRLPKSIAFASMDETAFEEFFNRCIVAVHENWGIAKPELAAAIADLITP